MQFQTILGKFCIEYALNFEIDKKENKIIYFWILLVLRVFSVILSK